MDLTKKDEKGNVIMDDAVKNNSIELCLKKLNLWEEYLKTGKLFYSPVPMGETVYTFRNTCGVCRSIHPDDYRTCTLDKNDICRYAEIIPVPMNMSLIPLINESVFLTEEAAKQAKQKKE